MKPRRTTERMREGDPLFKPRPNADKFDYYEGNCGGDVHQSIKGADPNDQDEPRYWPPGRGSRRVRRA